MSTETATRIRPRQIELKARPDGVSTEANFQICEETLSPITEGEFLFQNEWMSVDPYMRGRMNDSASYVKAFQIGEPLEGGSLGSVVCQIAKSMDCRVIGSAGDAKKIAWLREKAQVDEGFNYNETEDLSAELGSLAPNGIDVYFDNVGG